QNVIKVVRVKIFILFFFFSKQFKFICCLFFYKIQIDNKSSDGITNEEEENLDQKIEQTISTETNTSDDWVINKQKRKKSFIGNKKNLKVCSNIGSCGGQIEAETIFFDLFFFFLVPWFYKEELYALTSLLSHILFYLKKNRVVYMANLT
ncbi:hypothetical protein RFI_26165, partial [Reticulomyxa filosa]